MQQISQVTSTIFLVLLLANCATTEVSHRAPSSVIPAPATETSTHRQSIMPPAVDPEDEIVELGAEEQPAQQQFTPPADSTPPVVENKVVRSSEKKAPARPPETQPLRPPPIVPPQFYSLDETLFNKVECEIAVPSITTIFKKVDQLLVMLFVGNVEIKGDASAFRLNHSAGSPVTITVPEISFTGKASESSRIGKELKYLDEEAKRTFALVKTRLEDVFDTLKPSERPRAEALLANKKLGLVQQSEGWETKTQYKIITNNKLYPIAQQRYQRRVGNRKVGYAMTIAYQPLGHFLYPKHMAVKVQSTDASEMLDVSLKNCVVDFL